MAGPVQSARRVRLSVAMLARDEAEVLPRSIESVAPIAEETVVLDTGSSDRTPAVAQQLGARVLRSNWTDDFSASRNLLLRQVTGEWVLWLDAGEWLEPKSAEVLRRCVEERLEERKAYQMLVEAPPVFRGASAERIVQVRLMPRHPQLRFEGRLGETLGPAIERLGFSIDTAPGVIHRPARVHDPRHKARRARRNLRILVAAASAGGLSTRGLLAQGEAFADLGEPDRAREAFSAALEAAKHGSTEMLEAYYGLLTSYDGQESLRDRQMTACLEALEVFPLDAQLHLAMGNYLQARGRLDLAERSFRVAVDFGQVKLEVWHLAEAGEIAASCLALVLQLQGKDDEATEVLDQAMERFPDSRRIRRRAIELCVKRGRQDDALRLADALGEPERLPALREAIAGACRAAAGDFEAALAPLETAHAAGCDDPLCLRWLAVTLLSTGRIGATEPVLRQWLGQEPHSAEAMAYLRAIRPAEGSPKAAAEDTRWHRIDPAATTLDISPLRWPIIAQATTADPAPAAPG